MDKQKNEFLFSKTNYILMVIGVVMVILGFVLMSGGNPDPSTFDTEKVYGAQRTIIAPLLIIGGFVVEFIAIFKK